MQARPLSHRLFHHLPVWVSVAVVAVVLGVVTWALPRGMDMTDESWLYNLVSNNKVSDAWGYQHLLSPLFDLFGESVLAFRIVRLVGYVAIGAFLVFVAWRIAKAFDWRVGWTSWVLIAAGSQIGTFLAFSFPPRYLGYNELSAWLAEIGAGILLMIVADGSAPDRMLGPRVVHVTWAALGFVLVLLSAVKVSAGALFFVLLVLAVIFASRRLARVRRVLGIAAGIAVGFLVLAVLRFPLLEFIGNVLTLTFDRSAQEDANHSATTIVLTYLKSVVATVRLLLPSLVLFTVVLALLAARSLREPADRFGRLLGRLAVIFALFTVVALFSWRGATPLESAGAVSAFLIAASLIGQLTADSVPLGEPESGEADDGPSVHRFRVTTAIIVVATPLIAAIGSNMGIVGQTLYSCTIWAVTFAVSMVALSRRLAPSRSLLAVVPLIAVVAVLGVAANLVREDVQYHPYRSLPALLQTTPTRVDSLRGMLVTEAQAGWLDWTVDAAVALDAADTPTVALRAPGPLLAFNQSDWAGPWISAHWPISFRSIRLACESPVPDDLLVLQPGDVPLTDPTVVEFSTALEGCGVEFPGDFEIIRHRPSGDARYELSIWQLNR